MDMEYITYDYQGSEENTMAGEKRFGTSFFGFKRSDVNLYIEQMLKEMDEKLKQKNDEIAILRNQNRELKMQNETSWQKANESEDERRKISDVMITVHEQAKQVIEAAQKKADDETKRLQQMQEVEREKLVDLKQEVRMLRKAITGILRKCDSELAEDPSIQGDLDRASGE